MNKYKEREHKFKLVFLYSFNLQNYEEAFEEYFDSHSYFDDETNGKIVFVEDIKSEEKQYLINEVKDLILHINEIDQKIEQTLTNRKLSRVPKVDMAILRLAIFEIYYSSKKIDVSIVVNEAIEIAKKYGSEKSYGFVNKILSNILESNSEKTI
ncbi:MAG: transcription antitermination factor NusB [Eubacteriales bacterium]|nr:transcription antitermination factor NusB [Eubacteriales bacterium]